MTAGMATSSPKAVVISASAIPAAIPSVIDYNHCLGKLREIGHASAQFTSEYLDRRLGARHK